MSRKNVVIFVWNYIFTSPLESLEENSLENFQFCKGKMYPMLKLFQQLWRELKAGFGGTVLLNPISSSLFLFFFFFLLLLKLFRNKSRANLPPSPPKLPIIGNLHQLGSLPHRSLASLSEKYGPLMFLKLGQTPTLVVSSAKMAREIMKTHDIKFSSRPLTMAPNLLLYGCHDVGFAPYGEYWRQAKKMCVLELFSVKRVYSFQYVRDEEVVLLIDTIRKACNDCDSVNLNQLFVSTSNNIVCRCVLGEKFVDENGKSRFGDMSRRVMVLLTAFCVADFFPSFGWIDVLRGFIGELKKSSKTIDRFFDEVIEDHKAKMSTNDHSNKQDFVDIMLELQQEDTYHFTQDNLKAILLDMFVAGTDTTATCLEWTMTELMRNPNAMKKVQEEVRRVVGKKSKIEMNDIGKMEYMKSVIKESLRLYPPAPLLLPREIGEVFNIEGYNIPPKTRVFVNAWAIQRDPKIWDKPNDFIPERFMEMSSIDFHGQDHEFIPFGSGRRKCPAVSFGLASIEYILANLLYWFDWELPHDDVIDLGEENGLTIGKKIPLHLKPLPYI